MKKILVAIFMFCQFSFFVEALDHFEEFEEAIETLDKLDELDKLDRTNEFEEAIKTLDKLDEIDEINELEEIIELDKLDEIDVSIAKANTFTDILAKPLKAELDTTSIQKGIDETIESKNFYEIEYDDLFFEIGILFLYNKYNPRAIYGIGIETKYKNSYIIFQNCIDLVYIENNVDFVWTPTFFLGNSIIKIGVGTPLGIGGYIYEDNLSSFISIGARFSVKLTIWHISFEAYYQGLEKGAFGSDYTIKSNEFGLTLKISMDAH